MNAETCSRGFDLDAVGVVEGFLEAAPAKINYLKEPLPLPLRARLQEEGTN
jgi:hypothetical protein